MPHVDTGQLLIPWGGISPRSRRASEQGARVAVRFAASQASRMLLRYLDASLTDLEMHALIGIPESRASARRSGLMARGLVEYVEDVIGPFGAASGKYGLTARGRAVAEALR